MWIFVFFIIRNAIRSQPSSYSTIGTPQRMHKLNPAIVLGTEVLLTVLTVTLNMHLQYALNVTAQVINCRFRATLT